MAWDRISMNRIEWLLIEWNGNGMGMAWDRISMNRIEWLLIEWNGNGMG